MDQIGVDRIRMIPQETAESCENQPVAGFEELAIPLTNAAYNLARWLVQNDRDAEDLVQETYLKALRNFSSFQPGTNFRAWIFRILRNTFLNSRTTLESRMTVELDCDEDLPSLSAGCASPESLLIDNSDIAALRAAIEQLPSSYREAILLSDVEGLAYREIADTLGIPIGTVMSRLSRARKALRNALQVDRKKRTVNIFRPKRTELVELV
jgi:RNA polymerase sigma-70 factor, ECF subfamily